MAYLRKLANSPYYIAAYRNGKGKWTNRSTKSSVRSEAMALALQWSSLAKKANAGNLKVDQCRKVVSDIASDAKLSIKSELLETVFSRFIEDKPRAASTIETYHTVCAKFCAYEGYGKKEVASFTNTDISSYRNHLIDCGLCETSINVYMAVISACFSFCVKHALISSNPCLMSKRTNTGKHAERECFTVGDVKHLLAYTAGTPWHGAILVGLSTGLRIGDVISLKWSDIDLCKNTVTVIPQKTRRSKPKPMTLPLIPQASEWLACQERETSTIFDIRASTASKTFANYCEKSGIEIKKISANRKNQFRSKSFHSLRHTLATMLQSANVPDSIRILFTGHSSQSQLNRYTHTQAETMREALGKVKFDL